MSWRFGAYDPSSRLLYSRSIYLCRLRRTTRWHTADFRMFANHTAKTVIAQWMAAQRRRNLTELIAYTIIDELARAINCSATSSETHYLRNLLDNVFARGLSAGSPKRQQPAGTYLSDWIEQPHH